MYQAFSPAREGYQSCKLTALSDTAFTENVTLIRSGVLAAGVSPEAEDINPSPIQFLMLAYSLRNNPASLSVVSVHSISQTLTLIFAIK